MQVLFFYLLVAFVLLYPPAVLATACYKSCMRKKKLSMREHVMCWIPLANLATIRNSFYGSAKLVYTTISISLLCIVYRTITILGFYTNMFMLITSSIASLVAIACIWLAAAYTFYDTASCVRQGTLVKLCCIFLPPLGAYITSKAVGPYLKSVKEELEGTFNE